MVFCFVVFFFFFEFVEMKSSTTWLKNTLGLGFLSNVEEETLRMSEDFNCKPENGTSCISHGYGKAIILAWNSFKRVLHLLIAG